MFGFLASGCGNWIGWMPLADLTGWIGWLGWKDSRFLGVDGLRKLDRLDAEIGMAWNFTIPIGFINPIVLVVFQSGRCPIIPIVLLGFSEFTFPINFPGMIVFINPIVLLVF